MAAIPPSELHDVTTTSTVRSRITAHARAQKRAAGAARVRTVSSSCRRCVRDHHFPTLCRRSVSSCRRCMSPQLPPQQLCSAQYAAAAAAVCRRSVRDASSSCRRSGEDHPEQLSTICDESNAYRWRLEQSFWFQASFARSLIVARSFSNSSLRSS